MTSVAVTTCRVCGKPSPSAFTQRMLGNEITYFDCPNCGYLQTEAPYWLEQAYASPINESDTGILMRSAQNVGRVVATLLALGKLNGSVVDHAGGYGVLTRMLRDVGIDARWSDKYCENLFAKGFEAGSSSCDLLTAFEVFEHFMDPVAELRQMLARAPAVLLSTELITSPKTPPDNWWYLGLDHGQHIGFFRKGTFAAIAQQLRCSCMSDGASVHLFCRDNVPAAWPLLLKRSHWWPVVTRLARLRSKTVDDHHWIAKRGDASCG